MFCIIAEQLHSFSVAIDIERAERIQVVANEQGQISELRNEFRAFGSNQNLRIRDDLRGDVRADEVMIGGFGLKSKDGVIRIFEKIIIGNDDNPIIMIDRVSMLPNVILVIALF